VVLFVAPSAIVWVEHGARTGFEIPGIESTACARLRRGPLRSDKIVWNQVSPGKASMKIVSAAVVVVLSLTLTVRGAQGPAAQVQEAEKLLESGDVPGAVAALRKIVAATPTSFDGRLLLGRALDLDGRHGDARVQLEEAVKLANDEERTTALTSLGVSYAFESKPDEAARYYQRVYDADVQADDRGAAAGRANALGRIYLESGNAAKAEQWYKTGYEMARKIPGLPSAQGALWEMRWHNALGRIAARRGQMKAAQEHASAAKALLDRGGNEGQAVFYPYLLGYIAFFGKDYKRAVEELMKGDLTDPFVLGLIAQSYEKLGDRPKAEEYFRKVLATPVHNINSAFARPLARGFLR
jgi:tetratricopeptide (TPR) repeat protein